MRVIARTSRDTAGLIAKLRDQRTLLRSACRSFDEGSHPEAQNIALRLRVLLHDTRASHSTLGQLGVKDRLPYLDTNGAEGPPGVIQLGSGLCIISANFSPDGGTSRYAAPLENLAPDRVHPPQAFADWWSVPIVDDDHGRPISRRQFVLWLANEEGGAHVATDVDGTYTELSTAGVSRFAPPEGGDPRFRDLVAPTVRQIAYEVESTLDGHLVEESDPVGVSIRGPICSLSIDEKVTVGRNDPCPCGSGTKLKKCFDLREPRRQITMSDLMAELPPVPPLS